ncbi:MAG: hypothetical protein ACD_62C00066G0006 [uncultured bacterium]|nr:MAG: hypothetical protein ACD_62C00066G0006 [uncultured bacterium]
MTQSKLTFSLQKKREGFLSCWVKIVITGLIILFFIAVTMRGRDESACEACIVDQISLSQELVKQGLKKYIPTREEAHVFCGQAVTDPKRPCASRYASCVRL